jgi:hypothetical protein
MDSSDDARFPVAHWLLSCCGLLVLVGCGGDAAKPEANLVPVTGKVLFNNTPLADGRVTFIPQGEDPNAPWAEGEIDSNGVYTLKTKGKAGAPAGTYRALVIPGGESKNVTIMMDPRYANREQSPLIIDVTETKPPGGYDLIVKARGQF